MISKVSLNMSKLSPEQLLAKFQQERDELKLKLHLAKEDLSDDFDELEQQVSTLERKLSRKLQGAKAEASESAEDIEAAAKLLAEEIGDAFGRIKDRLTR